MFLSDVVKLPVSGNHSSNPFALTNLDVSWWTMLTVGTVPRKVRLRMFSHAAVCLERSGLLSPASASMVPSEIDMSVFATSDLIMPAIIGSRPASTSLMVPASSASPGLFEVTWCVIRSLAVRPLEEVSTTEHAWRRSGSCEGLPSNGS